jgi:para-nitrobenzyl esterase
MAGRNRTGGSFAAFVFATILLLAYGITIGTMDAYGAPTHEKAKAKMHTKYCLKNKTIVIDPLAHDSGEGLEIVEVRKPLFGKAGLLLSQAIQYTPATNRTGFDRFAYVIKDRYGHTSTGWVTIQVWDRPWEAKPPQAGPIRVTMAANGELAIKALTAVIDREEGRLSISAVGSPKLGTVSVLGNHRLQYLPRANAKGVDTFTYTVTRSALQTGMSDHGVSDDTSATGRITVVIKDSQDCTPGNGIGCTAAERAGIRYGGQNGCSTGTLLTLDSESGAPSGQQVCGIKTTDTTGADLYVYKGIQYADPPYAEKRWTDPVPPQWNTLRAVEFGPICPQGTSSAIVPPTMDEDCLYLNVWTPKVTPDGSGNLPVMVFIHGGAFISGSGSSAKGDTTGHLNMYDGSQFVATSRNGENIVFVTTNYRLGVLGFLAGDKFGINGNFGIKDQTKALQWVQRNIGLFGGDPNRVMIFGESAGAQSTALHLTITADNHQSLFQGAVMESDYAISYMTVEEAQAKADKFAKETGCSGTGTDADVMSCLRGLSVPWILDNQTKGAYSVENILCAGLQAIIPWNPVVDGTFVEKNPIAATTAKPFMTGSNLSESVPFLGILPDNDLESGLAYVALTDFLFGEGMAKTIRDMYLVQYPLKGEKGRFEQVVTDYLWTCFNRKLPAISSADTYRYHFIHASSFPVWVDSQGQATSGIPEQCHEPGVVCHAAELPFVFGNATDTQMIAQTFDADESNMSLALRNYWIQFARTSQPNMNGQTQWPLNASGNLLQMQAPASAIVPITDASLADPAHCAPLWDVIGYEVKSSFTCF